MGHSSSKTALQCRAPSDGGQTFKPPQGAEQFCFVIKLLCQFDKTVSHITYINDTQMYVSKGGWHANVLLAQKQGTFDYLVIGTSALKFYNTDLIAFLTYGKDHDEWVGLGGAATFTDNECIFWATGLCIFENDAEVPICVALDSKRVPHVWVKLKKAAVLPGAGWLTIQLPSADLVPKADSGSKIQIEPHDHILGLAKWALFLMSVVGALVALTGILVKPPVPREPLVRKELEPIVREVTRADPTFRLPPPLVFDVARESFVARVQRWVHGLSSRTSASPPAAARRPQPLAAPKVVAAVPARSTAAPKVVAAVPARSTAVPLAVPLAAAPAMPAASAASAAPAAHGT